MWRIVELILEAHTGRMSSHAPTKPLTPVAFASQLPPVVGPTFITVDATPISQVAGNYQIAPNVIVRVFEFTGKLFGNFPGKGEAELFALTPSEFTIKTLPGVRFTFERDAIGMVTALSGNIGPERFRGIKRN